jgi:hypothetical protein
MFEHGHLKAPGRQLGEQAANELGLAGIGSTHDGKGFY